MNIGTFISDNMTFNTEKPCRTSLVFILSSSIQTLTLANKERHYFVWMISLKTKIIRRAIPICSPSGRRTSCRVFSITFLTELTPSRRTGR